MSNYIKQENCCFNINGEEFIYIGITKDIASGEIKCCHCRKPIKNKAYQFNSVKGFNDGTYETFYYGSECVKNIIQVGYKA